MSDCKKALVIDDEEGLVNVLTMFLEDLGIEVVSYMSVKGYLDEHSPAATGSFDYLIIDHNLPGTKGLDFVNSLGPEQMPAKIILTSGEVLSSDLVKGNHDILVLTKPFDFEKLESIFL